MATQSEVVMAHRFLYYVAATPAISDQAYDKLEEALPDGDPVKESVGSDNPLDYTHRIKRIAHRLWEDHNE